MPIAATMNKYDTVDSSGNASEADTVGIALGCAAAFVFAVGLLSGLLWWWWKNRSEADSADKTKGDDSSKEAVVDVVVDRADATI